MIWLETLIVLGCLMIGARKSGMTMGFAGGVGLVLLVFVCGLRPAKPPVDVLLIITAVSGMAATLQCAGGLDFLVSIAEKILRSNPNRITIMAPIVTFFFTVFTGTSYVAIAVFPVISEVAMEAKVRVERPMSIAMVACQHGISASPISASTAAVVGVLALQGVTLGQIMIVAIPSILIGCILGAISVYKRGVELEQDPEFQRRVQSGEITYNAEKKNYVPTKEAKISVAIFTIAVALIVILGSFKELVPSWVVDGKTVSVSIANTIEMIAFAGGFIMAVVCKVKPGKIARSEVFSAGMTGVTVIFGVAWMTNTFFLAHKAEFIEMMGSTIQMYPWLFGIVLFVMSAMLMSQGTTSSSLMPVGASLGLPVSSLVAVAPAVNGIFIVPATGTAIRGLLFDRSGTTHIGKYILNHSYQRPGFVTCISSVAIGFLIAQFVF